MEHLVQSMPATSASAFGVRVAQSTPMDWLQQGAQDMRANLGASLGYGALFFVLGYVLLALSAGRPYLFLGAVSGFFLVAPLLLAGVYQISRQHHQGEQLSFLTSLKRLRGKGQSLADFGLVLVLVTLCWQMLSALLFAFHYDGVADHGDVLTLTNSLFVSGTSLAFLASYLILGGVIAAVVFAISAVSVPLLLDRKVDVVTAMITSVLAVRSNMRIMFGWAALIVGMTALGFATAMIGLIFVVPLLGHTTWHAYKAMVE